MKVVVTKAQLDGSDRPPGVGALRACRVYLKSPEWDSGQQALVYADWEETSKRLLSSHAGTGYLDWLVTHQLVPMTREEFVAARGVSHGV
jgi:hypothetical protein